MKTKKLIKIFVIEDNKIFAVALKADIETAFVNMPIKIEIFGTGEQCKGKFKEEKPQIVILDYHLNNRTPGAADGIKVLDWIKKINHETHVIMLTGDDNIDIALQSFKYGASDYIVKTDTQFRKIIFSLFNIFRMMEAKKKAKKYMFLAYALCFFIVALISVVSTIYIFDSSVLNP